MRGLQELRNPEEINPYRDTYTYTGSQTEIIARELKALEIIKETPEFVWYVNIYKNAFEMITDVKGFRLSNSVEELQEMFDLLKEVLK